MQAGYYNGHYPLHGGTSWNNPQCFDGGASNGNIQQSGGSGRMQQQPEGFFDEQPF